MKKYLFFYLSFLFLLSCKESYKMPNYFRHHENGNVKQITINTFQVVNGALTPYPDNCVIIWGEDANGTSTYDKNGNILSDNFYDYSYDDDGRLIYTTTKNANNFGSKTINEYVYNELNEIQKWGDKSFRYNNSNQICEIVEVYQPHGYYPGSHRKYEYFDDGQLKSCNFNHNKSIYGSEYNDKGELQRHVQLMEGGKTQQYQIDITKRDDKGNWIERRITGVNYNGMPEEYLQTREIRYY